MILIRALLESRLLPSVRYNGKVCHSGLSQIPMTINVSLTPQLEELVRRKVDSGQYTSASEVVREALRLLDAFESVRTSALARLRADVDAGWKDIDAGRVSDFDGAAIKRRGREKLARAKGAK